MSSVPPSENSGGSQRPAAPVPQIVVQQPQPTALGKYGKFVLILLVMAVMSLIGTMSKYQSYFSPPGGPQEKFHSLSETAQQKIAIINVSGAIMESDGFVKKQIDRVREDDSVVGVVLRIDSPGGTVTGSDYLYHHLRELREERELPLVVSMGSMCASGGYYIAMAVGDTENTIFAEPTSWTGSIGVVIPHYDFSGLLQNYDIKDDSIASHKYKLMGSPTRKLDPEERAEERELFQELVNISFESFKEIVKSGRPEFRNDPAALDKVATGQIFTAKQAVDNGLVDEIGFVEKAIERAAELAGHDPESLRCVKYDPPPNPFESLMGVKAPQPNMLAGDLRTFLDLTAPRAYYLCTWLPAVLSNTLP